jgi:hypothetical protein
LSLIPDKGKGLPLALLGNVRGAGKPLPPGEVDPLDREPPAPGCVFGEPSVPARADDACPRPGTGRGNLLEPGPRVSGGV